MGRCCFYAVGTLSLLLLVTSVTLLVARVFQKAVDRAVEKVRRGCAACMCVRVFPLRTLPREPQSKGGTPRSLLGPRWGWGWRAIGGDGCIPLTLDPHGGPGLHIQASLLPDVCISACPSTKSNLGWAQAVSFHLVEKQTRMKGRRRSL